MKRLLLPLVAILLLGTVAWLARPRASATSPVRPPRPVALQPVEPTPALPPEAKSPTPTPKAKPRVWPAVEQPIVPGAAAAPRTPAVPVPVEVTKPLPATLEDLQEVSSWRKDDPETVPRIQSLLASPDRPTSLKLQALEKLRAMGPERAAPLIVEFVLSKDAPREDACVKPTALGLLADFGHPAADRALAEIAARSREAAVQSTLLALSARPRR